MKFEQSCTEIHILPTDVVKHKVPHMPIVAHEYLMSLTVLSANIKINVAQFQLLLTMQILCQVHSFKTEPSMNFKLYSYIISM